MWSKYVHTYIHKIIVISATLPATPAAGYMHILILRTEYINLVITYVLVTCVSQYLRLSLAINYTPGV